MTRGRGFAATLVSLSRTLGTALVSERVARQPGLMQSLDPRVRVIGVLSLVLAVTLSHNLAVIFSLFVAAAVLALLSRVSAVLPSNSSPARRVGDRFVLAPNGTTSGLK